MVVSFTTTYTFILWPRNSTPTYLSKRIKNIGPQKNFTRIFIVALFIITKNWKLLRCWSTLIHPMACSQNDHSENTWAFYSSLNGLGSNSKPLCLPPDILLYIVPTTVRWATLLYFSEIPLVPNILLFPPCDGLQIGSLNLHPIFLLLFGEFGKLKQHSANSLSLRVQDITLSAY